MYEKQPEKYTSILFSTFRITFSITIGKLFVDFFSPESRKTPRIHLASGKGKLLSIKDWIEFLFQNQFYLFHVTIQSLINQNKKNFIKWTLISSSVIYFLHCEWFLLTFYSMKLEWCGSWNEMFFNENLHGKNKWRVEGSRMSG